MVEADLAGFVAANDLVRIRDSIVQISKGPEMRGRTVRELTAAAYLALLKRFVGSGDLPVAVPRGEEAIAARMAAMARADVAAQKRAGVA